MCSFYNEPTPKATGEAVPEDRADPRKPDVCVVLANQLILKRLSDKNYLSKLDLGDALCLTTAPTVREIAEH